jgi:hypothetical protein
VVFTAIRSERTRGLIADGNDNCSLSWIQSPGNTVAHRGKDLRPAKGDATLISMSDPYVCTTVTEARGITVSVPRKVLTAMVPRIEDRFGSVLVQDSEPLRLLGDYIGVLDRHHLANPELRRAVVTISTISWRLHLAPRPMSLSSRPAVGCAPRGCARSRTTSAPLSRSRA